MKIADVLDNKFVLPFNALEEVLPERMVVFGAGGRGRRCRTRLKSLGIDVPFFVDNDPSKHGTFVDGAEVLTPEELLPRAAACPVLVSSWAEGSIVTQLQQLAVRAIFVDGTGEREDPGIAARHAQELDEVLASLADEASRLAFVDALLLRFQGHRLTYPTAYPVYAHPLVRPRKGDVIVDGGAAEGDTLVRFLADCQGDCSMHLFEPTPVSYTQLQLLIATRGIPGAVAVNKALWSADTTLRFQENLTCTHSNHVAESGGCKVAAIRLDSYAEAKGLKHVDLIKLDIEGAELEALKGAAEVIRRDKPRLQICLYHKAKDLWEIPLYIKSIVPEYRMFVGHHSCCLLDTVLYCVSEETA